MQCTNIFLICGIVTGKSRGNCFCLGRWIYKVILLRQWVRFIPTVDLRRRFMSITVFLTFRLTFSQFDLSELNFLTFHVLVALEEIIPFLRSSTFSTTTQRVVAFTDSTFLQFDLRVEESPLDTKLSSTEPFKWFEHLFFFSADFRGSGSPLSNCSFNFGFECLTFSLNPFKLLGKCPSPVEMSLTLPFGNGCALLIKCGFILLGDRLSRSIECGRIILLGEWFSVRFNLFGDDCCLSSELCCSFDSCAFDWCCGCEGFSKWKPVSNKASNNQLIFFDSYMKLNELKSWYFLSFAEHYALNAM